MVIDVATGAITEITHDRALDTGPKLFHKYFIEKWRRTLAHQSREGWFAEYGGADLGYSLLALDLLAAGLVRGWSLATTGRLANAAGALVTSRLTCADAMPTHAAYIERHCSAPAS